MRRFPARQRAIVAAVRAARVEAGLSQRTLSARLHEPVNYIQRIESLERGVATAEFMAIARACGIAPSELMKRAEI